MLLFLNVKINSHQVVFGLGHVGIIWSQFALVDVQSTFIVLLHLLILPLVLTQQCQVVQLLGHIRMVCTENLRGRSDTKSMILFITMTVSDR